jgi:hypothetical protein
MKRIIIFTLFLSFVACKNAQAPEATPVVVALELTNKREWIVDTSSKNVELPYTRVRTNKIVMLSKILARHRVKKDKMGEKNPENKAYYESEEYLNAIAEQIQEYTFYDGYVLSFEEFKGQLYLQYNSRYLVYSISLSLVKSYIE